MRLASHNALLYGIILGVTAGLLYGVFWIGWQASHQQVLLSAENPQISPNDLQSLVIEKVTSRHDFRIVKLLGELFINALRMLVVPLVLFSMITGIANLGDIRHVGRTGRITLIFFLISTGIAVLLGLVLVNVIQPGVGTDVSQIDQTVAQRAQSKHLSLYDVLTGLVTPNLIEAMVKMDIMPLILFGLVFGAILTTLGERGRLVLQVMEGCNEAVLKFVQLVVSFAPLGIFGLVGAKLGQEVVKGNLITELARLGKYVLTVELGLLINGFVILPCFLFVLTRRNPILFFKASLEALFTAFSSASSSATLPVTLKCVEVNASVAPRYAGFVCPLGATINMNGTALYEAVAAMFVAQAVGTPLGPYDQLIIFLTATLAAIGAPGIPEAGLVTMVVVFQAVGLDPIHIGTLFSIDWFLDRCRTTINVWGDMVGAAIVEKMDSKGVSG
jgi:Na+/H+-dicarboxylate symporter